MKKKGWLLSLFLLIVIFFLDSQILYLVTILRNNTLTIIMKAITSLSFLAIILIIYSLMLHNKEKILLLFSSVAITYLVVSIIKILIMRERPDLALFYESGYSFPSNHAGFAFSTIPLMNREFPSLKWIFLIIAFLISFSRIYLGVHYPSDLIAGALIGYGAGLVILNRKIIYKKINRLLK